MVLLAVSVSLAASSSYNNKDEGEQKKQWLESLEYKMGDIRIESIVEKLDYYIEVSYEMDIIYLEDGKEIDNETNYYFFVMELADPKSKEGESLIQQRTKEDAEERFPLRVERIREEVYVEYEGKYEYDQEKKKWSKK